MKRNMCCASLSGKVPILLALGLIFSCIQEPANTSVMGEPSALDQELPTVEQTSTGVAVVELFTSQGCSSCPPADKVLRAVVAANDRSGRPVYGLSFHVDYWNSLGWTDPYSSPKYTARQRAYAAGMDSSRVYTPQMIVNGRDEFVGSNAAKAATAIEKALGHQTSATVKLTAQRLSDDSHINVAYDIGGMTKDSLLNVALVRTSKENQVPRGENAGRKLSHANIVRSFKIVSLDNVATGEVQLTLPDDFDAAKSIVIAYVQDRSTLQITGAAKTSKITATAGAKAR